MALSVLHLNRRRDIESMRILLQNRLRNISEIKIKYGGDVKTIWTAIKGYVFTNDENSIKTNDGFFIKCNDQ